MIKLTALRAAILASPLKIKAANLLTFVEDGSVKSWRESRNAGFLLEYSAKIIVTDYAGAPQDLCFVVLNWLHRDNPDATEDAFKFAADIISHKAADVEITVELSEIIAAETRPEGTALTPVRDPDAGAIDLGDLYPDLPDAPADGG